MEVEGRIVEDARVFISGEVTFGGEFGDPAFIGRVFTRNVPLDPLEAGRFVELGFTKPPLDGALPADEGGFGRDSGPGPSLACARRIIGGFFAKIAAGIAVIADGAAFPRVYAQHKIHHSSELRAHTLATLTRVLALLNAREGATFGAVVLAAAAFPPPAAPLPLGLLRLLPPPRYQREITTPHQHRLIRLIEPLDAHKERLCTFCRCLSGVRSRSIWLISLSAHWSDCRTNLLKCPEYKEDGLLRNLEQTNQVKRKVHTYQVQSQRLSENCWKN